MRINFELEDLDQYDLTYLSLGAGVQSSCLFYMACLGDERMPKVDFAVFSDTFDEPQAVYKQLKYLQELGEQYNIPVYIVSKNGKPMSYELMNPELKRIASIPAFTKDENGNVGMLRRQCTGEYKIQPIVKFIKSKLGYKKGQHVKKKVLSIQGISLDEIQRMKEPQDKWQESAYPLVTHGMNRHHCNLYIEKSEFRSVEKSACVYCPFHGNTEWLKVKAVKADWDLAVKVDKAVRNSSKKGIEQPMFLHRSCKPLEEVNLGEDQPDLFDNECDGVCGL